MHSIPDWEYHEPILAPDIKEAMELLDKLRGPDPILWSLTLRHRTSRSIAAHLGMPHASILYELREYKKRGHVTDDQAPQSVVWRLLDDDLVDLSYWCLQFRRIDRTQEGGY